MHLIGLFCRLLKPIPPGTTRPPCDAQELVPPSSSPCSLPALSLPGAGGIGACCHQLFIISAPLLGLSLPCQAPPFVFWDVMPPSCPNATLGQGMLAQDFGIWSQVPHDYLLRAGCELS